MKRVALQRRTPPRAPTSSLRRRVRRRVQREGPLTPDEWRERVMWRPLLIAKDEDTHLNVIVQEAHHAVPKSALRERHLFHRVWDERNGEHVSQRLHEGHTNCSAPLPRHVIREETWEFAREVDEELRAMGKPAFAVRGLERAYPVMEEAAA